jgi:hypothetical protein
MRLVPDLDNLMIEAKFFSPLKDVSAIRMSIFNAIITQSSAWRIIGEGKNFLELIYYFSFLFQDRKEIKKKKDETDKYIAGLRLGKSSAPGKIRVSLNEEKEGTIISVLCLPNMYSRLTQLTQVKENEYSVFEIQSAILECQELILHIFHGLLDYKIMDYPHPKKPVELKSYEFLKNTKEERELKKRITSALEDAKKEVYICGWVGQAIIPCLRTLKDNGVAIKIITKTPEKEAAGRGYRDKATAMEQLMEFLSKEDISLVQTWHSRILIIDGDNIFVGSMDMDSESFDQREECAVWSNDPSLVIRAKVFFEALFKSGKHPSK